MNQKYRVLGVMSGSSLDGIDLAICTFKKTKRWQFEINKYETIQYPPYWKEKLQNLHTKGKTKINNTDKEYGEFLAKQINLFLNNENIDFIASHGHTIFHQPEKRYTLQIGDGQTIANITQKKTITKFRNLDISLYGQGAPLVPIGDLYLFRDYKYCINLGGIANISIKEKNKIIAFDICPVNIIMNKVSQNIGLEFDTDGNIARKGTLIIELLEKLNSLPFYKDAPPKSLSREWVNKFIDPLIKEKYKTQNVLNTLSEHISIQIGKLLKGDQTLVTGGGAFNNYLVERISHHSKTNIILPDKKIINFKEALIFGFLGVLRVRNENNCLKSVTGAKYDNCGGEINNPM